MNDRQMTLGETRVRLNFNPSANQLVEEIKKKSAELIDLCQRTNNPNSGEPLSGEEERLWSLAQTHYEDAAMWAVKAATA